MKSVFSFAAFIGGVVLIAFLINQFVFQSYFVEGTSMVPTLQNGDRLIIEKVSKTTSAIMGKPYIPNRGDIVVLDSTIIRADGAQEQLIKRVIGLPGDKIHIENGTVTVASADEPEGFDVNQRLGLELEPTYSAEPQNFSVPDNHVFVMGDNRTQNGSHDSRAFGAVDVKDLEGRLWARILPVSEARVFGTLSTSLVYLGAELPKR
jgi:signal peptidase I